MTGGKLGQGVRVKALASGNILDLYLMETQTLDRYEEEEGGSCHGPGMKSRFTCFPCLNAGLFESVKGTGEYGACSHGTHQEGTSILSDVRAH